MLLTRLQAARTDTYTYGFVQFWLFAMACGGSSAESSGDGAIWSPDYFIVAIEGVQTQYVFSFPLII